MPGISPGSPADQILRFLIDQSRPWTGSELARELGIREQPVKSALAGLSRQSRIRMAGKRPNPARPQNQAYTWEITDRGRQIVAELNRGEFRRPGRALSGRPARTLKALRENPGGLTTSQVASLIGMPVTQQSQTWLSNILNRFRRSGHAEITGRTPGGWQNTPQNIWSVTSAGLGWLAAAEAYPEEVARAAEAAAILKAEQIAAALQRQEALAAAREQYGPVSSIPVRRQAAAQLKQLGCTLEEIGAIFRVSREQIRQDLLRVDLIPRQPRAKRRARVVSRRVCPHCLALI